MPKSRRLIGILCLTAAAMVAAGCSSSSSSSSASSAAGSPPASSSASSSAGGIGQVSGKANVAFAGSLLGLMNKTVGPAFSKATGAGYSGQGTGAFAVSKEISSGEITPNVFLSIGPLPITQLGPKYYHWYVSLVSAPIVIAYSPKSKYASQFEAIAAGKEPMSDLFAIMAKPGFVLGRTDPNTDPQGQAFYEMIQAAQSYYKLPAGTAEKITGGLDNSKQEYEETGLEGFLESGQLDAASAYRSTAIQDGLHYINLPDVLNFGETSLASTYAKYTIKLDNGTIVHGVPTAVYGTQIGTTDAAAADAFIAYLLQPSVRAEFVKGGYTLVKPQVYGTGAPSIVTNAVSSSS
ncbi:MAG TPA: extracellular solute-binding protein [Trebonia sp.]|nr:extracellular solute-binding protein [Trebonia sp.]